MQPNGRVFKKVILGKYIWLTYTQVAEKLKKFGSGLQAIGHQQRQNIVIFAETKAEWIIAAQACFTYNYPGEDCYLTPLIKLFYHCICTASCCVVNSNRHDFYLMWIKQGKAVSWHISLKFQIHWCSLVMSGEIRGDANHQKGGWARKWSDWRMGACRLAQGGFSGPHTAECQKTQATEQTLCSSLMYNKIKFQFQCHIDREPE